MDHKELVYLVTCYKARKQLQKIREMGIVNPIPANTKKLRINWSFELQKNKRRPIWTP